MRRRRLGLDRRRQAGQVDRAPTKPVRAPRGLLCSGARCARPTSTYSYGERSGRVGTRLGPPATLQLLPDARDEHDRQLHTDVAERCSATGTNIQARHPPASQSTPRPDRPRKHPRSSRVVSGSFQTAARQTRPRTHSLAWTFVRTSRVRAGGYEGQFAEAFLETSTERSVREMDRWTPASGRFSLWSNSPSSRLKAAATPETVVACLSRLRRGLVCSSNWPHRGGAGDSEARR